MSLSMFLQVIDGGETIRVSNYNKGTTMYEGKKVDCPYFDVDVVSVWTLGGKMVIEVA